jgi:hypothetical protein
MGAFDGIRIPGDRGYPTAGFNNPYQYFSNFSFSFFEGFGEPELRQLLAQALARGSDTVWVPDRYNPRSSGIGLHTWYVQALLDHHFGASV